MGLSGAALVMPEGPAFLLGEMTRLVGQGAVHLVAGEFGGCAQGGAVALWALGCKAGRQRALAGCPVRAAKRRLE